MKYRKRFYTGFLLLLVMVSCSCKRSASGNAASLDVPTSIATSHEMPQFSADSAYQFVAGLCDFGPRVPGTDAQKACAKWLKNQLLRYGSYHKHHRIF